MDRCRILIVDDEIIIARELEERLKQLGYEVVGIAASGREATALALEARPDLVLMDIVLQGEMDGIQAAAEIRATLGIPVIYVTAYTDRKTLDRARVTEPFAYIVKPFSEGELHANIEMARYKHEAESRLRRMERWCGAALDGVADAVIAADRDGLITLFNPAAEAITEWPRNLAMGRKLHEIFRVIDRAKGHPVALEGAETGPLIHLAGETRLLDRSGRAVPVDIMTSCVRDARGRPGGTVSVFRDLSGQRHAALVALNADVALAAAHSHSLREMLQLCTEAIVRHLNAAFARVWILEPESGTLVLEASAGQYTQLDGAHARIPVGQLKIGRIAEERLPHMTNDVLHDPHVADHAWAEREGMVSFAGYPLLVDSRLIGVLGLFSRQALADSVLEVLKAVAGAIAVGFDRKRTEAERDALLKLLRTQIDRMPVAYMLLDMENRVREWNPAAERVFGFMREEMLGEDVFAKIGASATRRSVEEVLGRLTAGDMSAHSVQENRTRDGRTITCEWLNTPLMADDGSVQLILCLAQDVTARLRLEDEVRQSRQRLEGIVASSPSVLYILKGTDAASLELEWISENVKELLGYTSEEVMRPDWWRRRVHPEDLERATREIDEELFRNGRLAQEYRFLQRDGKYRWVRSEMRRGRDDSGNSREIVGSWSDITERRVLEDRFRQAHKLEAIGSLAGGIAHDFNNLLTVITGYSEMLQQRHDLPEPAKHLAVEISKAGERAASLTRQLLIFSRKQIIEPKVLDINASARDQDKMLRRLIGEDVEFTTILDSDLKPVKADAGQIEQVIVNLAVNARDAMPQGGRLTIETRNVELDGAYALENPDVKPGEYAQLTVSDTGCGMTPEILSRVFEPFFTTKGPGKGTGLGLSTVYGIVKQAGGHLAVYSEPGLGTSFKVYFPCAHDPVAPGDRTAARQMPRGTGTILLVEDEDSVRALARSVLESCGYAVIEASNGAEALRMCAQHPERIDLTLTDVVMPEMAGRVLAEHLAILRPDTRVLYMSGYTDDAVIRQGILQREASIVQKPFTPLDLAIKVREMLDRA